MHSLHTAVTVASLAVATCVTSAFAQSGAVAYTDSHGRQWRQVDSTVLQSWNAVAAVCPTDGVTPCAGTLGGVTVNGWVWATRDQVIELLSEFSPAVSKTGLVSGSAYYLQADWFLMTFNPTYSWFTSFSHGGELSAWTSSVGAGNKAFAPRVAADSASPASTLVSANQQVLRSEASPFRGVWLFKPPVAPCPADLNHDGSVGPADLAALLGAWGGGGAADISGNGIVGAEDLSIMLAAWGSGSC